MEGKLVLTESTGGRRNGLGKAQDHGNPAVELWSNLARMSDTTAGWPTLILTVPSTLLPGFREKAPIRSIWCDCPDPAVSWSLENGEQQGNVSRGFRRRK